MAEVKVVKFYNKYVEKNYNMFLDDDLWFAIYLYCEKKSGFNQGVKSQHSTSNPLRFNTSIPKRSQSRIVNGISIQK